MMEPIGSEIKNGSFSVLLKCVKCSHLRKNKLAENDNFDILIKMTDNESNAK